MAEEDISRRLRFLLSARRLSARKLAQIAGLPQTDIYPVVNGNRSPQIRTLKRICDGLGISLSEFFSDNFGDKEEALWGISSEEHRFLMGWRKLGLTERKRLFSEGVND